MRFIFGVQFGYLEYYIGGRTLVDLFTKNRTDSYTRNTSGQCSNQIAAPFGLYFQNTYKLCENVPFVFKCCV